jgi:hypothetical protein
LGSSVALGARSIQSGPAAQSVGENEAFVASPECSQHSSGFGSQQIDRVQAEVKIAGDAVLPDSREADLVLARAELVRAEFQRAGGTDPP